MVYQGGIPIKRLFIIVSVIVLSVLLGSCSMNIKNNSDKHADNVFSFDLSTQYETSYRISLDTDRVLHTYVYEDDSNTYTNYNCIKLTQEQYVAVKKQIDSLGKFDENFDTAVYDYWTVNLKINSEDYFFTYGLSANKNFDKFIDDMIDLSSIDVIDSNGNRIIPFE